MKKRLLIEAVLIRLGEELASVKESARAAHEAATHSESKAEDQYDTRGLEASYLAGAQAKRAADLEQQIQMFRLLLAEVERAAAPTIGPGSLVEVQFGTQKSLYYLVVDGGGITVQVAGRSAQVITPKAPLGEALIGKAIGDVIEIEIQGRTREYEVLQIS